MDAENLKIYHHYGEAHQRKKLKEELNELVEAVDDNDEHMKEEIADVLNVIDQFIMAKGWGVDIYRIKYEKVERQKKRIKKMTNKQTCDGLDCAWCGALDCPRENERKNQMIKKNEILAQINSGEKCKQDCISHKLFTHNLCLTCNALKDSPYHQEYLKGKTDDVIAGEILQVLEEFEDDK